MHGSAPDLHAAKVDQENPAPCAPTLQNHVLCLHIPGAPCHTEMSRSNMARNRLLHLLEDRALLRQAFQSTGRSVVAGLPTHGVGGAW